MKKILFTICYVGIVAFIISSCDSKSSSNNYEQTASERQGYDANNRQSERERQREIQELKQNSSYKGPALDMFSTFRTPETKVKDIDFTIQRRSNPDRNDEETAITTSW